MKKSVFSIVLVFTLLAALLAGCGNGGGASEAAAPAESTSAPETADNSEAATGEAVTLVVGASPAPHAEILEELVPILAEQNIELQIKEFNDYILPNVSLDDGSLDANYFQHLPYLENYNEENGTDLVSAAGIHVEPMGIYPGRASSLDELTDGATIGIPSDPTNGGRALLLLEDLGFIEVDPSAGIEALPDDITSNPLNLEFVTLEAALLPVSLPDVDFGIINGNYAVEAGLIDTVLANEGAASPYVNVIAVRNGDESRPEIQALLNALQSEDIRTFIEERYDGTVIPVF